MIFSNVLNLTEEYIYLLYNEKSPTFNIYHDIVHTKEVVEIAGKIGKEIGINDLDLEILLIAAWFHDTGHFETFLDHEEISSKYAEEFLVKNNYPNERIERVLKCIIATKVEVKPQNLIEEIICDADLSHLGTDKYFCKSELLRTEIENRYAKKFTDYEWIKSSIDFFIKHKFYTKYAKDNFEGQKQENLLKLQKRLRKAVNKIEEEKIKVEKLEFEKEKFATKKETSGKPERSVETMWRNTMRTHVSFSAMADNKAQVMISVNTLLLTAIVAFLIKNLSIYPQLIIPTSMLTLVSLVSLIYSVLVTRPNITSGTFTNEDVINKKVNLLFFGNFYKMNLENFSWGMNELMNDKDYLSDSMIRDYYFLGQVLGKKYAHLRISYNIFMFGLILAVIAFVIALTVYPITGDLVPIS
ncbi:MAG: Pycsar system effector family protein [bacterium]